MKQLGEKLRIMRRMLELSQKDVAAILHIDRSTYTYYELGKTEPPLETVVALSNLFSISLDDLLKHQCSLETFQILYHRKIAKMSWKKFEKEGDKHDI
ncbi:helix-turn-helix domain-containing protein [Caproicibacter sp. BJN0012]|uniref:helix-turn-helix domain-containing protein n=1 Tax=Caproicibacter sp. BJN0012 TaxID=3110227 RepID=UPI002E0E0897